MYCKKLQEKLTDYINDELPEKDKQVVMQHLNDCAECRKELAELKSLNNLMIQFKPAVKYPYPSDDFLVQVRRKIRTRYSDMPRPSIIPRLIPVFASFAAVLIIVIGITLYRNSENTIKNEPTYLSALESENTSATFIYDNLDSETQDLVTEQIINDTVIDNLAALDFTITTSANSEDLIAMLTDEEKEMLVQEMLDKYEFTQ
jgi:hypothetical protein